MICVAHNGTWNFAPTLQISETKMRLTDILIKSLKVPATGQKTHFDDALPGFGVRVSQGGAKSFVVMFGPKRQLKTIGRYPELSLADARREAKRVQVETATAIAPLPRHEPVPFDTARTRFLADSKLRHKARTHTDYDRLLHRHFSFSKDIDALTRTDIVTAVEKLAATPSEQHHAFVAIRAMMNWCAKRGILDHSPVPALTFRSESRSNVLSDTDLKTVYNRAIVTGYPYGSIVQLLILTGQRRGEIASLRRSWIENDLIVFPAGFTKNKREHRCPVSPVAQELIKSLPDIGDMLFPARGVPDHPFNG